MRHLFFLLLTSCVLISCNDFENQNEQSKKESERNEAVFKSISKEWQFTFPKAKPEAEAALSDWNKWQQFKSELEQKPRTSILAFQMKIKNVASKADSLHLNVPEGFNNPQVRSRLITLNTKINSLNTYMHLQLIPEKKISQLIKEINSEIKGFYTQLDEVIIKKAIPKEIGEDEMIRALDTTRMATQQFLNEKSTPTIKDDKK